MKINDFLIKLIILPFVIVSVIALVILILIPNFSPMVSAVASILLAIGTFFMVYITYESYKTLADIQKRSFDPYLSVSLWKHKYHRDELLIDYGITIKNDGPGMAKNVVLTTNWILTPTQKDSNKTKKHDLPQKKYEGEGLMEIGNIGSKEKRDISFIIGANHYSTDKIWGIKIAATCEDIFCNKDEKYFDAKEIFLPDAEIKPLTIPS